MSRKFKVPEYCNKKDCKKNIEDLLSKINLHNTDNHSILRFCIQHDLNYSLMKKFIETNTISKEFFKKLLNIAKNKSDKSVIDSIELACFYFQDMPDIDINHPRNMAYVLEKYTWNHGLIVLCEENDFNFSYYEVSNLIPLKAFYLLKYKYRILHKIETPYKVVDFNGESINPNEVKKPSLFIRIKYFLNYLLNKKDLLKS